MANKPKNTEHTEAAEGTKRTRRTPAQLFTDAVKEKKDEIESLKTKLQAAEKDYAAFVEQAKVAMGL